MLVAGVIRRSRHYHCCIESHISRHGDTFLLKQYAISMVKARRFSF